MEPKIIIGKQFVPAVLPLLEAARESVKIIVYDWRLRMNDPLHPVSVFTSALVRAAERGVEVRALVSNEMVRRELMQYGLKVKMLYNEKLVHAKVLLVDDRLAVVGSHNYSQSAFTMNLEVSLAVDLLSQENELTAYFNRLWPL